MIGRGRAWIAMAGVCLLFVVSAQAAFAATFGSEMIGPVHVHGTQEVENVFTVNNRTVKCKNLSWSGEGSGPNLGTISLSPSQSECTAFGLEATVDANGCEYELAVTGPGEPAAGSWGVKCPPGEKIVIEAPNACAVEIGEQALPGGVDLTNIGEGASRGVDLLATAEGVTATVNGSVLICGTNGVRTNGRYTGTITLKGYADAGQTQQVGVFVGEVAPLDFRSEVHGPVHLDGPQEVENVFTVNNRTVRCKNLAWTGGIGEGPNVGPIIVAPDQSECTGFGLAATIDANGCAYELDVTGLKAPVAGSWSVICPPGEKIVIDSPGGCTVEIGEQTIPGGVDLANKGEGASRSVEVLATAEGITATVKGSLLLCGTSGVRTNGKYSGTITMKGYADPAHNQQVGLFIGSPPPPPSIELHSEIIGTTQLQASQVAEHLFTINNRTLKCHSMKWSGLMGGLTTTEVVLAPTVSACTFNGFDTTVEMNGCTDRFNLTGGEGGVQWRTACPPGKAILLKVSNLCTIEIGAQAFPQSAFASNQGAGTTRDVRFNIAASGIRATVQGSTTWCGPNGVRSGGEYFNGLVLKGFKDPGPANQVGLFVE